eukprot:361614-Chlamydomonas_euryale.AAC.3
MSPAVCHPISISTAASLGGWPAKLHLQLPSSCAWGVLPVHQSEGLRFSPCWGPRRRGWLIGPLASAGALRLCNFAARMIPWTGALACALRRGAPVRRERRRGRSNKATKISRSARARARAGERWPSCSSAALLFVSSPLLSQSAEWQVAAA